MKKYSCTLRDFPSISSLRDYFSGTNSFCFSVGEVDFIIGGSNIYESSGDEWCYCESREEVYGILFAELVIHDSLVENQYLDEINPRLAQACWEMDLDMESTFECRWRLAKLAQAYETVILAK